MDRDKRLDRLDALIEQGVSGLFTDAELEALDPIHAGAMMTLYYWQTRGGAHPVDEAEFYRANTAGYRWSHYLEDADADAAHAYALTSPDIDQEGWRLAVGGFQRWEAKRQRLITAERGASRERR